MRHYDISLSLIDRIYSIYEQLHISHMDPYNVRRFLRKTMNKNGIKTEEISHVPIDVLYYMYLTSKGLFGNVIIS